MNKKTVIGLMVVCLLALAAMCAMARYPTQYDVRGVAHGDTVFVLGEGVPMFLDLRNPARFHMAIGSVGGYRIPVAIVDIIVEGGGGVAFRLYAVSPQSSWVDSLHVFSMGDADSIRIFGR